MQKVKTKYRSSYHSKSLKSSHRVYMVLHTQHYAAIAWQIQNLNKEGTKEELCAAIWADNLFCFEVIYHIVGVNNR